MENRIINDKADLIQLLPDNYTGYIWMVEHQKPIIHNNEALKINELNYRKNPHNKIQEAYLYDGTNSIHIKNIDGEELIFVHNEADFNIDMFKIANEFLELPAYKLENISSLFFKQVYKQTESLSGNDFKTWQPIVRLFKGFSKPKTNTQNQPKNS